jgi:hypothetical protein
VKRIILALSLAFALAGCASLTNTWNAVTGATVSPAAVIVAANAFDALEVTATNYLKLVKCNGSNGPVCRDPAATKVIIPAVRSGRVARNNLEQFLKDNPGQLGPSGLYNALTASINTLQGVVAQYQTGASK